jgi:hypothetical protein
MKRIFRTGFNAGHFAQRWRPRSRGFIPATQPTLPHQQGGGAAAWTEAEEVRRAFGPATRRTRTSIAITNFQSPSPG